LAKSFSTFRLSRFKKTFYLSYSDNFTVEETPAMEAFNDVGKFGEQVKYATIFLPILVILAFSKSMSSIEASHKEIIPVISRGICK